MTYAVFDLTPHTQLSIRGTTGTHPDSEFVFGVFISTDEIHAEQTGFTPDFSAYDDVEWERAVQMAKWILEWDERFRLAKELDTTVGIVSDMRETYSKIDEWGGKWMKKGEKE